MFLLLDRNRLFVLSNEFGPTPKTVWTFEKNYVYKRLNIVRARGEVKTG